jgi:glucokinase
MSAPGDFATNHVLVGDIGGSTARFAIAVMAEDGIRLDQVASRRCADYGSFEEAAESFLAGLTGARPTAAAVAVAGPVTGDRVALTNHAWSFSIAAARRRLGLERLHLLNDFGAIALALPGLRADELRRIGAGVPKRNLPMAVIGPGTGLGVATLIPAGQSWRVIEGEGGHATFAPMSGREDRVVDLLRRRHGHVSWERVLSGPGLVNLHAAISEIDGLSAPALSPEQVVERGLSGGDPACRETLTIFCAALGTAAGNLAVTVGARGGVFIAGGIVPRLGAFFDQSDFRSRFEAKGRMSDYARTIPTYVITAAYPGLLGAAASLQMGRGMET